MQQYGLENANTMPLGTPTIIHFNAFTENIPTVYNINAQSYLASIQPDIFSIQRLLVKLALPNTSTTMYILFGIFSVAMLLLIQKFNPNFWMQKKLLILFALILTLSFDYFIPALRFSYNYVQLILLIGVIIYFNFKISTISYLTMGLGIVLNIFKINFIPDAYSLGEVCCIFAALLVLVKNKANKQNEIFELGWLGRYITTWLGLYPKMGYHK